MDEKKENISLMEPKIVVALISSVTALVVSIITVLISAQKQRKQSAEIERLKFALEQEKIQREERRNALRTSRESIDQALVSIQKLKDTFLLLIDLPLYSDNLSLDSLSKIGDDIRSYVELFSGIFPKLDEVERIMLHSMKRELHKIECDISLIKQNGIKVEDPFWSELVNKLRQARMDLTNLQQKLLSGRNDSF